MDNARGSSHYASVPGNWDYPTQTIIVTDAWIVLKESNVSYRLPPGDQRPSEMVELLPAEIMALKNMEMFFAHIELLYKERPLPRDKDGADSHIGWKSELWDGLDALRKAGERLSDAQLHVRNHDES